MSREMKSIFIPLGVLALFGIITFALAAATLGTLNRRTNTIENRVNSVRDLIAGSVGTTIAPSPSQTLVNEIRLVEVMDHLKEFQRIADSENGTRAVSTLGFNRTLEYILTTLRSKTNYVVSPTFFNIRQFALNSDPVLISSINGLEKNYTFSQDLSKADFYFIRLSEKVNDSSFRPITVIPNVGCTDEDWQNAKPLSANGRVVLVKRGVCAFELKGSLAAKYQASALLIYNDGVTPDRNTPLDISLGQSNKLPALFLSYQTGKELADAALNGSLNVGVRLIIDTKDLPLSPVGNICADTPTGDPQQTIVIGSHSDSVTAGPGINDNGSGSAANLGLAIALGRLFQTSTYAKYKYRVRFCWWGAEEIGLLGSKDHVDRANRSTDVGERLQDYLINLNYDMLGSPNYIFGIYDGQTANNDTPTYALEGSNRITTLFREWFQRQNLPWDHTDFSGRSDYGPFLETGIVAGGLFSGGDSIKSRLERDRYDQILGVGRGGISGITYDPCYHLACDSIQNINVFAMEKMIQAAAYALEYLGQHSDLATWLYPTGRPKTLVAQTSQRQYFVDNKHWGSTYL